MDAHEKHFADAERRQERMLRRVQPALRAAATEAGLFSGCGLSRCRRAKHCLGRHPDAEIGSSHFKKFPPCVSRHELQIAMLDGMHRLVAKTEQKQLAEGRSPEEIEQAGHDYHDAIYNADDWPEDPLAHDGPKPVKVSRRAARKGG